MSIRCKHENVITELKPVYRNNLSGSKPINVYKNGELLKTFPSVKTAVVELPFSEKELMRMVKSDKGWNEYTFGLAEKPAKRKK